MLLKNLKKPYIIMKKGYIFMDIMIILLILIHIFISPYTKVEESMNLQAIHDIIFFGIRGEGLKNYDCVKFPGPVPRTFIGAILTASVVGPVVFIKNNLFNGISKSKVQYLVRGTLGIYNSLAIIIFRQKVIKYYGMNTGLWYGLFQASQFHIMYYASRTLPNMFAFGIYTIGVSYFIEKKRKDISKGLFILTFTAVIFRFEIIILVITHSAYFLFHNKAIIKDVIKGSFLGGILGLISSMIVDSWFWREYFLWPEGVAFYFNIIKGKSSEWGVLAWHTYFSKYIPKLLLNPFFFILLGIALLKRPKDTINLLVPNILYVIIYSLQPHKEWRFIVYIIPSLTLAAAIGATWIYNRKYKSLVFMIAFLILIITVLMTFIASLSMSLISSLNYPGGWSLKAFHNLDLYEKEKVHLDVYTCMTGVSLFLCDNEKIIYDKTENKTELNNYDFLKTIDWAISDASNFKLKGDWIIKDAISGYSGFEKVYFNNSIGILAKLWYPRVKMEKKILILKSNKH
ncbi:hypothetical protein T552_00473 [Pneumocystis carinii B80]|uniref:Mannosyltransferase n=1 Tax=Pneumocystis carinii (strain B80) TaxID=1408658 RepID=A0A0W4ZQV6_PNEC8|nr:hypothetical protein T552_00473 [Pneumocystis carinii B80]KTW30761.1 hypothetical protein T552_00473 [Pneumocystis carinii B80]